ncbi:hypothetical protein [Enterococcus sp. AZ163]
MSFYFQSLLVILPNNLCEVERVNRRLFKMELFYNGVIKQLPIFEFAY